MQARMSLTQISPAAIDLICGTPLIALDRVHPGPGRLLAEAEFLQPGGSVKDRSACAILMAARSDGRLQPSAPVVEMTSGNMGAGLAVTWPCWGIRSSSPCPPGTVRNAPGCLKPSARKLFLCRR